MVAILVRHMENPVFPISMTQVWFIATEFFFKNQFVDRALWFLYVDLRKQFQVSAIWGPEHGAWELSKATESATPVCTVLSCTDISLSHGETADKQHS